LQLQLAIDEASGNEAEISRATSEVADQNQFAIADVFIIPVLRVSIRRDPRIKRGQWFFKQSELLEPGTAGGFDRQLTRFLIERTRHGEDDFLMLKTRFPITTNCAVPGVTQMHEVTCGLRPVPPTAAQETHERGTPHQRCSEYRSTPRQNLSCPDRFRSDNGKTPTTHRLVFSRIFSSSFQRWPSRDTHQTSRVPSSVTRVSSRTGTIFPTWPSSFRVTCSGLRSSISSPQSSKRLPTWSCLRTLELRKRNSAGSPTTSPNSLSGI